MAEQQLEAIAEVRAEAASLVDRAETIAWQEKQAKEKLRIQVGFLCFRFSDSGSAKPRTGLRFWGWV